MAEQPWIIRALAALEGKGTPDTDVPQPRVAPQRATVASNVPVNTRPAVAPTAEQLQAQNAPEVHAPVRATTVEWNPHMRALGKLYGAGAAVMPGNFVNTVSKGQRMGAEDRESRSTPLTEEAYKREAERKAFKDKIGVDPSAMYEGKPEELGVGARTARFAQNMYGDLGDMASMVPVEILDTLAPRFVPASEKKTPKQLKDMAFAQGVASGKNIAAGMTGGALDMLEHPISSFESRPIMTTMVHKGAVSGVTKLGKAGLEKARPGITDVMHEKATAAVKPVTDKVQHAATTLDNALGNYPKKIRDQYIAKFVDGFHAGDPRATQLAEKIARGGEIADEAIKSAAAEIARSAENDRRTGARKGETPATPAVRPEAPHPMDLEGAPPWEPLQPVAPTFPEEPAYPSHHRNFGLTRSEGLAKDIKSATDFANEELSQPVNSPTAHEALNRHLTEKLNREQAKRDAKHEENLLKLEAKRNKAVGDIEQQAAREAIAREKRMFMADKMEREAAVAKEVEDYQNKITEKRTKIIEQREREIKAAKDTHEKALADHAAKVLKAQEEHTERVEARNRKHVEEVVQPYIDKIEEERYNREQDEKLRDIAKQPAFAFSETTHAEQTGDKPVGTEPVEGTAFHEGDIDREAIGAMRAAQTLPRASEAITRAVGTVRDLEGATADTNEPRLDESLIRRRLERVVGGAAGDKPVDFRSQFDAAPEATAREYLKAVEKELNRKVTKEEAKGLVKNLADEKQGNKPFMGVTTPTTERVIPHLRNANGWLTALDPAELIGKKELSRADQTAAIAKGVERVLSEHGGDKARKRLIEEEANRPITSAKGELTPDPYAESMYATHAELAPIEADEGVRQWENRHERYQRPAEYASGVAKLVEKGGLAPQILPEGISAGQIATALEEVHAGDPKFAEVIKQLKSYQPLDKELLGHGGEAAPLMKDALEWHAKADRGMRDALANAINQHMKAGFTIHALPSLITNFIANLGAKVLSRGRDPMSYLNDARGDLKAQAEWQAGEKVSPKYERAFKALSSAGVGGNDFVSREFPNRNGPTGTKGKTRRAYDKYAQIQEHFYQAGDKVFRTEEAIHQINDAFRNTDELGEGRWMDIYPTARQTIRITKRGGEYFAKDKNAPDATLGAEHKISREALDKLCARQAGLRATFLTQDYGDLPQYAKWVKTMPLGIISPFSSWYAAARSLPGIPGIVPGKKGLLHRMVLETPNHVVSNDPRILARAGVKDLGLAFRRAVIINGIKQDIDDGGPHSELAQAFRNGPEDMRRWLIRAATQPGLINGINLGSWAALGPDEPALGALAAAASTLEGKKARGFDRSGTKESALGQPTKFSRAVAETQTGSNFTADKVLDMLSMGGSPVIDIFNDIQAAKADGKVFEPAKEIQRVLPAFWGGTTNAIVKSVAGTLTDTTGGPPIVGPDSALHGPLMVLGGAARERAITADDVNTAMPLFNWYISNLTGKGWQAKNFNVNDPAEVSSFLSKAKKEWHAALELDTEPQADKKEAEAIKASSPKNLEPIKKFRYEAVAQDKLREAVDKQIEQMFVDYKKVYLNLYRKNKEVEATMPQPNAK